MGTLAKKAISTHAFCRHLVVNVRFRGFRNSNGTFVRSRRERRRREVTVVVELCRAVLMSWIRALTHEHGRVWHVSLQAVVPGWARAHAGVSLGRGLGH